MRKLIGNFYVIFQMSETFASCSHDCLNGGVSYSWGPDGAGGLEQLWPSEISPSTSTDLLF